MQIYKQRFTSKIFSLRMVMTTLVTILFCSLMVQAQQATTIKGTVIDAKSGEPLIGANIFIKELAIGAAADIDGRFSFVVSEQHIRGQVVTLAVRYIGFKTKEEKITLTPGVINRDFKLDEDVFQMDAVVVTGIASKTSKAISEVAVSRVSASKITELQPSQNLSQLLSGKISGVNINISSGNAGSGYNFFVRGGGGINGDGQPLIYVDGVRVENLSLNPYGRATGGQRVSSLSTLNPNDIENIEVLKGPAAASTYGTNASNGVVLITTKSGKLRAGLDRPYMINYQFTYGTNEQPFKYPSEFLNADTLNGVLKNSGIIREHTLNINGSVGGLRYYASYQNRFDAGTLPNQNYLDRNTLKANIDAVGSDKLVLRLNTSYSWAKIRKAPNDDNLTGWIYNALLYYPVYTTDKSALEAISDKHDLNNLVMSGSMQWTPLQNFEINAGAGVDFNQYAQDQLLPYGYTYRGVQTGERAMYKRESRQNTYDLNARYNFKDIFIDRLTLSTIVGTQIIARRTTSNRIQVQNFSNANIYEIASAKTILDRGDFMAERREAGIFANFPFSYDDTYFWTLGIRRDYSSAVGSKSPSITYPNLSLAVRLDRFSFLPSEIPLLKLRTSYGESGQLPNNTDGLPMTYQVVVGGGGLGGYNFNAVGNREIEPERIKEYEFGFDTEFLRMFSLEFTYYMQNATKSIVRSTLPPSTGLGDYSFPYNVGSVETKGFETLFQVNPIRTSDYDLAMSFIWNYQKNRVVDLGGTEEIQTGRMTVLRPGFPKFQFFEYQVLGAKFDAAGKYTGEVDLTSEKVSLGNPFPDHSGSVSLNFRFLKNFQLYGLLEWGLNNRVFSYNIRRSVLAASYKPYLDLQAKLGLKRTDRPYDPSIQPLAPGTPEYIEAANEYAKMDPRYYGNFIYNAAYLYFRELSISYDFTELLTEFFSARTVSGVQVGIAVRNLFKLSKYKLDPELNFGGPQSDGGLGDVGTDMGSLPQPRTINFWVRLIF